MTGAQTRTTSSIKQFRDGGSRGMRLRDVFSLRNAVTEQDPDTKVAKGLADFERRHGRMPRRNAGLVWDGDRIEETPLF
jgi:hypothetical protein